MLAYGTTTAEAKSGYGLELAAERRILRAIKTLSAGQPVDLTATFMGAHEVPIEYRGRRADYVKVIVERDDSGDRRRRPRRMVRRVLRAGGVYAGRVARHSRGRACVTD